MSTIPVRSNYLAGEWVAAGPPHVDVVNPATGEVTARIPDTDDEAVDTAVRAAKAAFGVWRRRSPFERAGVLHAVAREIESDIDAVAVEITREMGKPLDEARGEVRKLAEAFHFYAEETTRVFGHTVPNVQDGFLSVIEKEPIGVVAAVTPWNYPVELIGWKLAAALGAGCTIVVKPSEFSPSSAVRLFECLDRAGVPAGVANLVLGVVAPGQALVRHPLVDKVAFTGSAATGAAITRSTASAVPLSMELGGSCPLVVTASADLEDAVAGAVRRGFRNAGQICIAINRVYVHADLYEEFVARVGKAVATLRVGDGLADPTVDMGPVTNPEILDKTAKHVADALERGARLVAGGSRLDHLAPGLFYAPTVVADVTPEMLLGHAETFGPVIGVTAFTDLDEAIALANGTEAGLAAYAYATDLAETFRLGRELDFGNVAVNNVDAGIMNAPYGGRKGSGYGYEHGREGLEGYVHLKHLRIRYGR
jgi:succinate-semialdehyde dehydrogenase / glutarate-semialdehyde dehydrogenase